MCCAFCQNWEISQKEPESRKVTPDQVLRLARSLEAEGNIGVAWTYNEPSLSFEFIRDTAPLIKEAGMVNVMVSNGYIEEKPLEDFLPYIDAWNIDLKSWDPKFYRAICGAGRDDVLRTIQMASKVSHVELTNLIIPGENDDLDQMEHMAAWIASVDKNMPLHITRFFPRYRMMDRGPTPISTLVSLGRIARKHLTRVRIGNVSDEDLLLHGWRN